GSDPARPSSRSVRIHITDHHWSENVGGPSFLAMTQTQNKQTVQKLFDTFNDGDLAVLEQLIAPDYAGPQGGRGPASFANVVIGLRGAFPDLHYTLDELIAEGDRVAVRWHWIGTHRAPFRGFPPTGKAVSNPGLAIFRLEGGKIVAASLETDRLGFLE